jgi:hypothetical protein
MRKNIHQFCVSWITLHIINIGTSLYISSWNNHRIPSNLILFLEKGIPDVLMMKQNNNVKVQPTTIRTIEKAIEDYDAAGGNLSRPTTFGFDALHSNLSLAQEE